MEAQLQRPSHSHEDDRMHSEVGGEKKSVLKKVKDKAKKMKETIKKHGPGHHHQHDDEEDHQVHGAPMRESTVVRSTTLPNENPSEDRSHHSPNTSPARSGKKVNAGSNPVSESGNHAKGQDTKTMGGKISSATYAVADKAKNMVVSKLGGGGEDGSNGQSMKEYLCEKLQPGEEDKALSEAITGALKNQNEKKEEAPPKRGKVTVSKEVAERLGMDKKNKREGEDAVAAGEESTGPGEATVAERLQNAVSSWLGKSNGIETAQDSIAHAFGNVSDAAAGRGPMSNDPHRH